jgi:hypothetical protein
VIEQHQSDHGAAHDSEAASRHAHGAAAVGEIDAAQGVDADRSGKGRRPVTIAYLGNVQGPGVSDEKALANAERRGVYLEDDDCDEY